MFYFGVNIGLNKLTDLPGDLVGEFIENRRKKKNQSIKTEIFNNGDKYIGELKDGYQNGQGTNFYANGDEYNGEFLNGKRHGQGIYKWTNGDQYTGEWKNSSRTGRGTYFCTNGDQYAIFKW